MIKRRYLGIFIFILYFNLKFCYNINAFFGQTHYAISESVINSIDNIQLSETEKNAFLSGSVCADIGRFEFDAKAQLESDSEKYVQKMMTYASTTEEKWFVIGTMMHVLQDKQTGRFLKNVFDNQNGGYLNYLKQCAVLDKYFLQKQNGYIYVEQFQNSFDINQIVSGVNVKSKLLKFLIKTIKFFDGIIKLYFKHVFKNFYKTIDKNNIKPFKKLIQKTYSDSEISINVTNEEIDTQMANILTAFIISCHFSSNSAIKELSTEKLKKEYDIIVDSCKQELNKILFTENLYVSEEAS